MNKKPLIFITFSVLLICIAVYFYNSGFGVSSVEVGGHVASNIEVCNEENAEPLVQAFQGPLYVRKGITNMDNTEVVQEIYTDVDGNFKDVLAPGEYCLVFDNKLVKSEEEEIFIPESTSSFKSYTRDKDCYDKSFAECDAVISVGRKPVNNISITREFKCKDACYFE